MNAVQNLTQVRIPRRYNYTCRVSLDDLAEVFEWAQDEKLKITWQAISEKWLVDRSTAYRWRPDLLEIQARYIERMERERHRWSQRP